MQLMQTALSLSVDHLAVGSRSTTKTMSGPCLRLPSCPQRLLPRKSLFFFFLALKCVTSTTFGVCVSETRRLTERRRLSVNIDSKKREASKLRLLLVNAELCGKLHPAGTSGSPKQTTSSPQRRGSSSSARLLETRVTSQRPSEPDDWVPEEVHLGCDWPSRRLSSDVIDCSSCC